MRSGKDYKPNKADWLDGKWSHLDRKRGEEYQRGATSAIAPETYDQVGAALTRVPDGFPLHKTVQRMLDTKGKMLNGKAKIDWATGEALAFGSLLTEGYPGAPGGPRQHARHL